MIKKNANPYYYELRPFKSEASYFAWTDEQRQLWRVCDQFNTVVVTVTVLETTRERRSSWSNTSGYRVITRHKVRIGFRIGFTGQEVQWTEPWDGGLLEHLRLFVKRAQNTDDLLYDVLYEARARLRRGGLDEGAIYCAENAENAWGRDEQGELVFDRMQALMNLYQLALAREIDILKEPEH